MQKNGNPLRPLCESSANSAFFNIRKATQASKLRSRFDLLLKLSDLAFDVAES